MNVLVLAPHPDDESIGCGGSILHHAKKGDRIVTVFLTSGELGLKGVTTEEAWRVRETEAHKAGKILGLNELVFFRQPDWYLRKRIRKAAAQLKFLLEQERPQLIYLPHPKEWHPDHQAALPIVKAALALARLRNTELRGYEIWTPLARFDQVEDISDVITPKLRAVRAYRSQTTEFDYVKAVRGLNQYRGAIAARCGYAEVFQDLRL